VPWPHDNHHDHDDDVPPKAALKHNEAIIRLIAVSPCSGEVQQLLLFVDAYLRVTRSLSMLNMWLAFATGPSGP
jgi:hypothetical protein